MIIIYRFNSRKDQLCSRSHFELKFEVFSSQSFFSIS